MRKKSTIALLLAVMMTLSLFSACGSSEKSPAPAAPAGDQPEAAAPAPVESNGKLRPTTNGKAENSLTTAYSGTVSTIDPELFTAQDEDTVLSQIYEPLFLYNNAGELVPVLAESWTENEDGSVDVVLRENVKFHSGDVLKSEDVLYTYLRTENSPVCSSVFGNVEFDVQDDTHFTMIFPNQDNGASFVDLAGFLQAMDIVNKSWAETVISDHNDDLVYNEDGTGPFVWGGIASNEDITLTRFEDYWDTVSLDTVRFVHITGSFEVAFESGDLDQAAYTSPDNFANICAYDNVYGYKQPVNRIQYIALRSGAGETFEDIRLRQAVAYAMNRDDLCFVATDGTGQVAYNLATPLTQYFTDNADHFEQDVEKSKSLMGELGYSDTNRLSVRLLALSSSPTTVSASEILKEELEQSFFTVTIEEIPDRTRLNSGDFDLSIMGIGLLPSFGSYHLMFTLGTGLNYANSDDSEVHEVFAKAKDEAGYQAAMKLTTEKCYDIPFAYPTTMLASDNGLNVGEFNTSLTCYLYKEFSWKD